MQLSSISLVNFGVFRGTHTIDLISTRERPIVLLGGKNGSGKTTILEALHLCLYGISGMQGRVSREEYQSLLERRIHKSPTMLVQPTFAAVTVIFNYADAGHNHSYEVTRSWGRAATTRATERLEVKRDGESLGAFGAEQWPAFVSEIIPPGISSLFFFDGEKIQQIAEDTSDKTALGESIKALLGIKLVDRLQTDLSIYQSRIMKDLPELGESSPLEQVEQQISELRESIRSKQITESHLAEHMVQLRAEATQSEQEVSAHGGEFVRRRASLVQKQDEAKGATSALEASLRHLCSGLLPFAFAPKLLEQVKQQLKTEQAASAADSNYVLLAATRSNLVSLFKAKAKLDQRLNGLRAKVLNMFDEAAEAAANEYSEDHPLLHHLSVPVAEQVLSWIDQVSLSTAPTAISLGLDLERHLRELHEATDNIKRIPADDVLSPLLATLNDTNQAIGNQQRQLIQITQELKELEVNANNLDRVRSQEIDRISKASSAHKRLALLPRVQAALVEFSETLISTKVRQLETEIVDCLTTLMRKRDSVSRVQISPATLEVSLFDRSGVLMAKEEFSAGEKQMYAVAVLWALARVSNRPLPLVVDTPLGRLDTDHRRMLVENYFPVASHQVILLSTDTEITDEYTTLLKKKIARSYYLEYDMLECCTSVNNGYFGVTQ